MITLSIEEWRDIIEGRTTYRKCPSCGGTGEWLYVDGYDLPVSPDVYRQAGGKDNIDNSTQGCTDCGCLGYVESICWQHLQTVLTSPRYLKQRRRIK